MVISEKKVYWNLKGASMALGKNNVARNRNSWGPMSILSDFHRLGPDEDIEAEYSERLVTAQQRQLDPLKEDLADWINKTLGINYISRENFFLELDNGVVLCHLAMLICNSAKRLATAGHTNLPVPSIRSRCFERANRRSFFSRDNIENFIKFCRSLGIHDNLLFETEDLVLKNNLRNVILCLLEVARIATKFGIEPPGLVQLEKEIAEEERNNSGDSGLSSLLSWQFQASPPRDSNFNTNRNAPSPIFTQELDNWSSSNCIIPRSNEPRLSSLPLVQSGGASDGVLSDNTDEEWSRSSNEDPDLDIIDTARSAGTTPTPTTELDRKVQLAARLMQKNCNCANGKCEKLRVRKVGEGKYNIAGKNVFIRLLKGHHMMVRVGGGWDTLDHFLLRHDPCQVKVVSRSSPDRVANAYKYLHIRAKYRSPPPRESVTR